MIGDSESMENYKAQMQRDIQSVPDLVKGPSTDINQSSEYALWRQHLTASQADTQNSAMRVMDRLISKGKNIAKEEGLPEDFIEENAVNPFRTRSASDPNLIREFLHWGGEIPLVDVYDDHEFYYGDEEDMNKSANFLRQIHELRPEDEDFQLFGKEDQGFAGPGSRPTEGRESVGGETFKKNLLEKTHAFQRDVEKEAKSVQARYPGSDFVQAPVKFASQLPAILNDPIEVGTILGEIALTSGLGTLGRSALTHAAVDAGGAMVAEAIKQPDIQEGREEAGLERSSVTANVIGAGIGGAALGTGFRIAGREIGRWKNAMQNERVAKDLAQDLADDPEVDIETADTARRLLEESEWYKHNGFARAADSFEDEMKLREEYVKHIKNIQQTREQFPEMAGRDVANKIEPERVDSEYFEGVDLHTNYDPVKVNDIDAHVGKEVFEEADKSIRPIVFEKEDGTKELIEGGGAYKAAKSGTDDAIQSGIIKEADGATRQDALDFVAAKRWIEGRKSRESMIEHFGRDPENMFGNRSQEVINAKDMRDDLDPQATVKFVEDDINNYAAGAAVAKNVKPGNQAKALELTKDAATREEARSIIEQAKETGFENVEDVANPQEISNIIDEGVRAFDERNSSITFSDQAEVEIDNELLAQLRRVSRENEALSEAAARQASKSGGSEGSGAVSPDAEQIARTLEEQIERGRITRDSLRKAADSQRLRQEISEGTTRERWQRELKRVEEEPTREKIKSGDWEDHPGYLDPEETKQALKERLGEDVEIGMEAEITKGERKLTMDELEELKKKNEEAIEAVRECR